MRWTKNEALGGDATPRYSSTFGTGTFAVLSVVNRSGRMDGVLSSYATNGATAWVKTLWNTDRFIPRAMCQAPSGDLYVVANVGPAGSTDTYAARVAPSGVTVWVKRVNLSAETRDDTPFGAAVDASGNLYITGEAYLQPAVVSNTRSAFVTKISAGGNVNFTRYYSISETDSARGNDVAVNSAGEIAVCVQNSEDRVWKLDATGVTQWVRTPIIMSGCNSILMDNSGSVYLGGNHMNNGSDGAPAIQKLNSAGVLQWTRWVNFDSGVSSIDSVNSMQLDASGNIFAAGSGVFNGSDFMLLKVSPTGNVLATRLKNSFGTNDDNADSLFMGLNDDVYLTGSMTSATVGGFMAVKADMDANFVWNRYSPTSDGTLNAYQTSCFNPTTGQILFASHNTVAGTAYLQCLSQPAVSVADSFTAPANGTLNGTSVLANDIYAADGSALLVANPSHGTVTLNSDGTFVYQPTAGYTGPDSFTYRVIKTGVNTSFLNTVSITVQ